MIDHSQELIHIGTKNRLSITEKYHLDENPELFRESSELVSKLMFGVTSDLELTESPIAFGEILDQVVVNGLKDKFNGTDSNDYGTRAAKAFIERTATKARDEIEMHLNELGKENSRAKEILDLLPNASSCAQIGSQLSELMNILGLDSSSVFEAGKRAKIDEFLEFYQRKSGGAA